MPIEPSSSAPASGSGPATGRLQRIAGVAGVIAVIVYFLFCAMFLILRHGVMPNIYRYKPQIEQMASRALGQPVTIATIDASWSGFTPRLALTEVQVRNPDGGTGLRLPYVMASLSWWSVVSAQLRLASLEIQRPDLDVRRDAAGRLFVAGVFIDPAKRDDGTGLDWVMSQRRIIVRDGRIRWNDARRGAPELVLEQVQVRLENIWQKHAFALKAIPPAALAAPLDVRGGFTHPAFASKIADFRQWTGMLYADLHSPAIAGWGTYVDLPVAVLAGSGSMRSWLSLNRGKVADLTTDLQLSGVSAKLGPTLPPLDLVVLNGRVSVSEKVARQAVLLKTSAIAPVPAGFGVDGQTIAFTNFSMQTSDGLRLPETTISASHTPARHGQPEHTILSAKLLDLETLTNFFERLPVPVAQRRMLQDFSPKGVLRDFTASWHGVYPEVSDYAVKGRFFNLSIQPQVARPALAKTSSKTAQAAVPAIPGFDNLTGSIDASNQGGAFALASTALKLHLPGYMAEPRLALDRLAMQANWRFLADDQLLLEVRDMQLAQQDFQARLSGTHRMPIKRANGASPGVIDFKGEFGGFDLAKVDEYLPLATPDLLRTWLSGALLGGKLQDGKIKIQGDLANFPFRQISSPTGNATPKGEFNVSGRVEKGSLNVAPGHFASDGIAPMWPIFEKFEGIVSINRTRMEVSGKSATVQNSALSEIKAVMPDLLDPDKTLTVEGVASGQLQELFNFVNNSPVAEWTGNFTQETRAAGNGVLALKLQLPLARLEQTKVQGLVRLADNDITLQKAIPSLLQTNGKFEFNEKGFVLDGLKATFLGGPVSATGGTQPDGSIVIKADGSFSSEAMTRSQPSPGLQRLSKHVSGGSRYAATIAVRRKQLEVSIDSSLQGLALDFPAPLKKTAGDSLPLKVELIALPGDGTALRDEIRVSLGTAMSAAYQRQKTNDPESAWRVLSGGIGVNVPAPRPDSGININVDLKTLDIDAWRNLIGAVVATSPETPAQPPTVVTTTTVRAEEPNMLSQYLEPEVLSARATELIVGGKKLDNVVVGVSHQKDVWQANIDAVQASGYLTWNESRSGRGLGKVTARLSSLIIPKAAASDVTEILEGKSAMTQIPALDIVSENFELFGKKMGRLELSANNSRTAGRAEWREWRINKLLLANADAQLKATGSWSRPNDAGNMTNLDYRLEITDAGRLLERFGFGSVLKGGKGLMEGNVGWQGLPFSLDVPSLNGQMRIDMASGQFLKVNPGAAKLLGVLSLQSLPRRLTLDFRDVFSEGFAFDGIAGTVDIANGSAKTSNLKMRSVSATVVMDGSADIAGETQDLHVAVIPEINVGTASVVYALAVNPVIGLGSFLAQLFLREPLMRAFTFEYRITGPWSAPQVVKINRNGDEQPVTADKIPAAGVNSGG
ncbi:MAG: YhdP family protein [Pseudomonadota bacterium]